MEKISQSIIPKIPSLKILHLITDLNVGGAESMLARLVMAGNTSNLHHCVISLTDEGAFGPAIRSAGISVKTLGLRSPVQGFRALIRLMRILLKERPNIMMTWLYHADLLGCLAAVFIPGTRLIWNIRCSHLNSSHTSRVTRALPRVLAHLSRLPNTVVVNSSSGKLAHEAYGYRPRRWKVIPNGFDTDKFKPNQKTRLRVRAELGVNESDTLVGMIARFDPMKDYDTFIAAAAQIVRVRPNTRLLLAGRGTDGDQIADLISAYGLLADEICRLGERDDIPDILTALDVAVSASITEGFSNTVGEAMASGVPCVVTDAGDSAIIVGHTGRIVPSSCPKSLADAIIELLNLDPEQRVILGRAARARIVDNYTLGLISDQYRKLFADVYETAKLRSAI